MDKNCLICENLFTVTGMATSRKYCFECSPSYEKNNNKDRSSSITSIRRAVKRKLVKLKGGCCEICGYDKCIAALEFHHSDPSEKELELSASLNFSEKDIKNLISEVDKCILVCSNCHREIHSSMEFYHR